MTALFDLIHARSSFIFLTLCNCVGRFQAVKSDNKVVFSAAACVADLHSLMNAAPLWSVLIVLLVLFFALVALSRCADAAALVHFCDHVTFHPDLRAEVENEEGEDEALDANSLSQKPSAAPSRRLVAIAAFERQVSMRNMDLQRSRQMRCRRIGIYVMNWTMRRCFCRQRRVSDHRHLIDDTSLMSQSIWQWVSGFRSFSQNDKVPIINSLAFLPDAYATALYSRYLKYLLISDKSALRRMGGRTAALAAGHAALHRGIDRDYGPPADSAAVAAAEADIARAMQTKSFVLRLWRMRWTILHVWAIQASALFCCCWCWYLCIFTVSLCCVGHHPTSHIVRVCIVLSCSSEGEPLIDCACFFCNGFVYHRILLLGT